MRLSTRTQTILAATLFTTTLAGALVLVSAEGSAQKSSSPALASSLKVDVKLKSKVKGKTNLYAVMPGDHVTLKPGTKYLAVAAKSKRSALAQVRRIKGSKGMTIKIMPLRFTTSDARLKGKHLRLKATALDAKRDLTEYKDSTLQRKRPSRTKIGKHDNARRRNGIGIRKIDKQDNVINTVTKNQHDTSMALIAINKRGELSGFKGGQWTMISTSKSGAQTLTLLDGAPSKLSSP